MVRQNQTGESPPNPITDALGDNVTSIGPEDGASRRWFLKRSVLGAAAAGGLAGPAAGTPGGGEPGKERIVVTGREIVALVTGLEYRRLFKLILCGPNAGLVQYVEDPIDRTTVALKRSAQIGPEGRVTIPGLSFTDLIVRSEQFVVAPGFDYQELADGDTPAPGATTGLSTASVSATATPSIISRYSRFRQRKSACQYGPFSGYTHLFKGASLTLSKAARDTTLGGLSSGICFVLGGGLAGAVICGAIAAYILSTTPGGRNFTVGLNDTDLGLPGFKSPFASIRVAASFGATLSQTVPIALSPGHVERQLEAEVLFPSGYTP